MTKISGQKPVITKARKAIAGFKIREGYPIGCMVTLRQERMFEFLDRLVTVALPRVRDFRGISGRGFDGRGNYNMGVKEQIIFPEIEYDKIDTIRGMNITITTTAKTDAEAQGAARRVQVSVQELRTRMSKLALINRQYKREKLVAKYAKKRAALEAMVANPTDVRRGPLRGAAEAAGAAAQRQPDAVAQPLRDHRSSARRVQQVRPRAQQVARDTRCAEKSPAS